MKNKIISIALSFIMIFSITPVIAEENINLYEEETGLLKALDILESDYKVTKEEISRGEFTKYLVYTFGMKANLGNNKLSDVFKDVKDNTPYAEEIITAYKLKLVNGFTDNTYRPTEKMAFKDAVTVLISGMGYGYKANTMGGYPTGYLTVAKNIGVLKNIKSEKYITKATMIKLLYNGLHSKMMTNAAVSGTPDKVNLVESKNFMIYDKFHIEVLKGIVNANDLTWLKEGEYVPPFRVVIGDRLLYKGKTNAPSLLGYNVTAYIEEGTNPSEDTIVYISKDKDKNKEIKIDIEDILDITKNKITVNNKKDERENYSIANNASVIYNKVGTGYPLNNSLIPKDLKGEVTLLANDGKDYNVVIIDAYKDYFVTNVNKKDYIIISGKDKIKLDPTKEDDFVEILDTKGVPTGFSSINRYSSVSCFSSKDDCKQKYKICYVSNEKVVGKVTKFYKEDNKTYITIGDKEYIYNGLNIDENLYTLKVGRTYSLTLDYKGRISGIREVTKEGENLGYIVYGKYNKKPVSEELYLKIFNKDKIFETYKVSDKVTVDGIFYKDKSEDVYKVLDKASDKTYEEMPGVLSQLITFEVDENEEIIKIDTVLDNYGNKSNVKTIDTDNRLFFEQRAGNFVDYSSNLSGKAFINNEILMFGVPVPKPGSTEYKNEDKYKIYDFDAFRHGKKYDLRCYYNNNDSLSVKLAVCDTDKIINGSNEKREPYAMYDKITYGIDKEGVPCILLNLYINGGIVKKYVKENETIRDCYNNKLPLKDPSGNCNIKKGDLVYFTEDNITGYINDIYIGYSPKENKLSPEASGTFNSYNRLVGGFIFEKYDDAFLLLTKNKREDLITAKREDAEMAERPNCSIISYDKSTDKISVGSYTELEAYDSNLKNENTCSYILYNSIDGKSKSIFIIK